MPDEPMMLDDMNDNPVADEVNPKDIDGVPYCRTHHCRMKVASGAGKTKGKDYYKCPGSRCDETGVKIRSRVETVVPPAAHECPRCGTEKKPVYLVRDESRSTSTGIVMVCPECEYRGPMLATPQLEAAIAARPPLKVQPLDPTIVTKDDGTPVDYFRAARWVREVRKQVGAGKAHDIHALRYTTAAELGALGLSDEVIMSVTGHASVEMVRKYAGAARQKARAREAQEKRK